MITVLTIVLLYALPCGPSALTVKAEDSTPVERTTAGQLLDVINALNENGGSVTVALADDITVETIGAFQLEKGELTILGEDHKLTAYLVIKDTAVLNLGSEDYDKTLQVVANDSSTSVAKLSANSVLNIYEGTLIGPHRCTSATGGIALSGYAVFNMYGGTIQECVSGDSFPGGVFINEHAKFNMYDGLITGCKGSKGGAVGLAGAGTVSTAPDLGIVAFNMYGGVIDNCEDKFLGGGGICAWTSNPVIINMTGGTIKNCTATGNGYGGAVFIHVPIQDTAIKFDKGTITGNKATFCGGIMVYKGKAVISDGFSLYDNTGTKYADDILSMGEETSVTLGTADTSAKLGNCGHQIDGWYDDGDTRWSFGNCTDTDGHIELVTDTGIALTGAFKLKAAHGEITYTVTWKNDDGSVLETDTGVAYGDMPSYDGTTPSKASTAQYKYTFKGWSPELSAVTDDVTYTATYTQTEITADDPEPVPGDDIPYVMPKTGIY